MPTLGPPGVLETTVHSVFDNITGISSKNGRHLGMMPHPERCIMNWQLPYISDNIPDEIKNNKYTPWYLMFYNAYEWCKYN